MFCLNCFSSHTTVKNSRPHKKQPLVWRRRYCSTCRTTFTTHERPSLADNKPVYYQNKEPRPFNAGKLIISLSRAFTHSKHDAEYSTLWLAQTIEDTLSTQYETITPEVIETVAHTTLRQFDEVAAMQYALQHQMIISAKRRGRPSLRERGQQTGELPSR